MDDLIYAPAHSLIEAIRTKEISAEELVSACLARIEAVNPSLNAVVQLTAEAALARARQADLDLAQGKPLGRLHGLPMTIKDSLDTAGTISTGGTLGRANFIPQEDATVVARLRAAGAILLGKTNTPELTLDGETENLIYGRTNSPYDPALSPAGSSGGAGAIVAAGGSPFDLGSDTGGSIRMPAHFCGIAGLKPTSGRVPRTGHIISFDIGGLDALTQIGPMARSVADLSLILPIIAGPDWRDPAIVPMPLQDPEAVDLAGLRLAFFGDNRLARPTAEVEATLQAAIELLEPAVGSVNEAYPPDFEQASELWDLLFLADGGAAVRQVLERAGTTETHPAIDWTQQAQTLSAAEFSRLLSAWNIFRAAMTGFMAAYDLLICPVCPTPAVPHGQMNDRTFSYTKPFNLIGWPVVVVRCGSSATGLPIGLQVVARPWREDVALAVAQHLETALGGWQKPPL